MLDVNLSNLIPSNFNLVKEAYLLKMTFILNIGNYRAIAIGVASEPLVHE